MLIDLPDGALNDKVDSTEKQKIEHERIKKWKEELKEKPLATFESISFLAGIAAALLSVSQQVETSTGTESENEANLGILKFINFLNGAALASFGGIIVSRIVSNIEIQQQDRESDLKWIVLVEAILLCLGIVFLMSSIAFCCFVIEKVSGILIFIYGSGALLLSLYAHKSKLDHLTIKAHRILSSSVASVDQEQASEDQAKEQGGC